MLFYDTEITVSFSFPLIQFWDDCYFLLYISVLLDFLAYATKNTI